jgi:hypothetical protein
MRSSFVIAFVVGFAGVLAAAYFVPWGAHARILSKTSVAMNGGREETFQIFLPADRIVEVADGERFPLALDSALRVPAELATAAFVAEHFKLRDIDGTVIGLATRHWTATPTGMQSVWAVNIPSRGTLVLAAEGDVPGQLAAALVRTGETSEQARAEEIEVALARDTSEPRVVVGTEEFQGVTGHYSETWHISGLNERGELQGTIVLSTVVNQT